MATILVIDDDAATQTLLQVNLQLEGHEVLLASDGSEGLHILKAKRPDLVLMDMHMPGVGGVETLKLIRDDAEISSTKVMLLSGTATEFDSTWAEELGADECMAKPFEPSALIERVNDLLANT